MHELIEESILRRATGLKFREDLSKTERVIRLSYFVDGIAVLLSAPMRDYAYLVFEFYSYELMNESRYPETDDNTKVLIHLY